VKNPFRSNHSEEAAETYLRTSRLLLQAIGLHAVEGEPHEYQSFRATIEELQSKLNEKSPLADGLLAVGAAAEAMHGYNLRTMRFVKTQALCWKALARMLVGVIGDLAPTAAYSAELRQINWHIGKAYTAEDIRDLKKLIAERLKAIRDDISVVDAKVNGTSAFLEPAPLPERVDASAATLIQLDSSLGSFVRLDAEAAIHESRKNGIPSFAVIFVIDRLRHINSRFGQSVSDRLIALFLQRLTGLLPEDRLFRWGEASFLALLERRASEDEVCREIERVLFRRLVETFTVKNQSVMIPISATWRVVSIAAMDCDATITTLDAFVAQNTR
jgi:GGDEF domain-containing protein